MVSGKEALGKKFCFSYSFFPILFNSCGEKASKVDRNAVTSHQMVIIHVQCMYKYPA